MICPRCGQEVNPNAVVCVNCGSALPQQVPYGNANDDVASTGMKVLAFFIPLVGIILYFTERNLHPNKAKSLLKVALISWGIWFVLGIIFGIASFVLTSALFGSSGYYYY